VLEASAIICAVRNHGEHGAVVRAITRDYGLFAGYVSGARSRVLRPVLIPGNSVAGVWKARGGDQLASLSVELAHSRAVLMEEPLAASAIDWLTSVTAATLPPEHPYPPLFLALEGVLSAIEAAPNAKGWAATIVRYEQLLLSQLGFGLDLESCAVTGQTHELAWVSPRSARAVSRGAGTDYEAELLPLPAFLINQAPASWPDVLAGLRLTGHFVASALLTGRAANVMAARERLVDRLVGAAD
jgi:DNA repair protein RecO (recombination protein O)